MLMQLDGDKSDYGSLPPQTKGHKGPTLAYRKIEQLEYDPLFLAYMQQPLFHSICAHIYGPDTPIRCFRAMFMNKPAHQGKFLPWHQDRWKSLDRDPLITIYLSLDPATKANGCIQLIPGSHQMGVVNPTHPSGFLTEQQAAEYCAQDKRMFLETDPGEVTLLHNWTLHGSDVNQTDIPRRAFSICYMHGRTNDQHHSDKYALIFGDGALDPRTVRPTV